MEKEEFEWIHSWCDKTKNDNLPRVLLIGDSITYGYQEKVRELLKDICYVDYISTSYSIDMKIYNQLIKSFVKDSKYDFIHFNNGLHGKTLSSRSYRSKMKSMITFLLTQSKVGLAECTIVKGINNKGKSEIWSLIVKKRNKVIRSLSEKFDLSLDELYVVSKNIPNSLRFEDGVHYLPDGYHIFAEKVANFIKGEIKKI